MVTIVVHLQIISIFVRIKKFYFHFWIYFFEHGLMSVLLEERVSRSQFVILLRASIEPCGERKFNIIVVDFVLKRWWKSNNFFILLGIFLLNVDEIFNNIREQIVDRGVVGQHHAAHLMRVLDVRALPRERHLDTWCEI